jgi:phospholipid/cholesterol/gamma-HCH transport system substrate-binding protein
VTPRSPQGRAVFSVVAFLCVIALVVVAGLAFLSTRPASTKYSAMLATVIGLYPGADVRVLGVPVGTVDTVTPQGTQVRVDFHVSDRVKVPAGAFAAVVSPTVVADRYLQLAPAYDGGPTMPAGTVIPVNRTASPAEFDDLLASTQKLSSALGPQGVNDNGALSAALGTLARNLQGNGQQINTTLGNFSQALTTLSANRNNIAGTITNLQSVTSTLKNDDPKVRAFTQQFAQVSGYLADERKDLGDTLRELSKTLGELADFIHDNRDRIHTNVDQLADVLHTLNQEKLSLQQGLDAAPAGLDGLVNAYNASSGTLDTRPALLQSLLCGVYNLFPVLQPVLGPILGGLIPGGVAGCANLSRQPISNLVNTLTGPLTKPSLPTGSLPALGALPPLTGGSSNPNSTNGSKKSSERNEPVQPRQRPSLRQLLGGGL